MRGARGQITAFVLIGLAILLVILVILMLRRSVVEIEPVPIEAYDTQLIKGQVETCLDLVAEDAFMKLGKQGGLLYESQGGLTPDNDPLSHDVRVLIPEGVSEERVRVSFGLVNETSYPFRPKLRSHPDYAAITDQNPYPFPDTLLLDLDYALIGEPNNPITPWASLEYDGPFGQYALSKACASDGANNLAFDNANLRCPRQQFPFPIPVHGPSMQENLEAFIEQNFFQCLDVEELATRLGTQVTPEPPNVTVTYTETETFITLDLPLRFANEEVGLQLGEFTRRYPVRLYKLSTFLYNLLHRASKDPFFEFDQENAYQAIPSYDRFIVTKEELTSTQVNGRDDLYLITVADPRSTVDKGTWFFQFLVQNRPPVLSDLVRDLNFIYVQETPFSIIVIPAIDPDGDELDVELDFVNPSDASYFTTSVDGFVPWPAPPQDPLGVAPTLNIVSTAPAGEYALRMIVTDSAGNTDWQDVMLEVVPSS